MFLLYGDEYTSHAVPPRTNRFVLKILLVQTIWMVFQSLLETVETILSFVPTDSSVKILNNHHDGPEQRLSFLLARSKNSHLDNAIGTDR